MIITVVGSRIIPERPSKLLRHLGYSLMRCGHIIRSGGADGSDSHVEEGAIEAIEAHQGRFEQLEIYLPRSSFNGRYSNRVGYYNYSQCDGVEAAKDSVKEFHPNPEALSDYAKDLMARNAMQVLGATTHKPADALVCFSPKTEYDDNRFIKDVAGGTGQAVRIAYDRGIPVYNINNEDDFSIVMEWVLHMNTTNELPSSFLHQF